MNTAKKGTEIERKAIRILESLGYKVYRTERNRFGRRNDIFGCFDIIAKRSDNQTKWIQVSVASKVSTKRKDVDATMPDDYGLFCEHEDVEVWGYVSERDNCRFRVWRRDIEGWLEVTFYKVVKDSCD